MKHAVRQFVLKLMVVLNLCVFTFSAQALEIKGIKVDETAQVGGNVLLLNGAGVRTKMMFKVYVAALYLEQKQTEASTIINDRASKRVFIHFLRAVTSEKLLHGMDEGFIENNSPAEMAAIDTQMKLFHQMMATAKEVQEGDVILLDYTPSNTQISLNGKVLGKIEGEAFNQALLRVWLGTHAVDASLKKAMLGQ